MTDTEQSTVATLRELLPEIEGGEGALSDDALVLLLETLFGAPLDDIIPSRVCRRPDTDLTAADDLVRECGYRRSSHAPGKRDAALAYISRDTGPVLATAYHPTDEPRAILAALVRARIAELEAKQ